MLLIDSPHACSHASLVSTVAIPLLTVENYKILPETGPRYQLIEGDLYMAPAPNRYHQDISRNLEYILLDYLEEHPIGKLYDAPFDVYLDDYNVFQPDILCHPDRAPFHSDRCRRGRRPRFRR